mgnify:CR=1 FL=1
MRAKIILWYNRNKRVMWRIVIIALVAIFLARGIGYIWKQNLEDEQLGILASQNNTNTELNSVTLNDDKSTVSGKDLTKSQTNAVTKIDEFVQYCNNNQFKEAYNLLSEDCKKEMYPTVEAFQQNYYNSIFKGTKKNVSVENWVNYIYKVKFMEDALATGIYDTDNTIQDYITVVTNDDDEMKLNINSYIGKKEINKEKDDKNINIKVLEKHQYMDYETYLFEITNNSDITILLNDNTNNSTDTMYLLDDNKLKYPAYTHELSEADLKLSSKETRKVKIKYYNKYSSARKIKSIVFSEIILNYYAYVNYDNVGYYKNYGVIQIDI